MRKYAKRSEVYQHPSKVFPDRRGATPVNSARIVPVTEGSAYTLQGTPATAGARGIVIEGKQKVVRK